MEHKNYLQSAEWGQKKAAIEKICFVCGAVQNIDIHHKSYKRLGHERPEDLIGLCRSCHSDVHALIAREYPGRKRYSVLWNAAEILKKRREKLTLRAALDAPSAPKYVLRKKRG